MPQVIPRGRLFTQITLIALLSVASGCKLTISRQLASQASILQGSEGSLGTSNNSSVTPVSLNLTALPPALDASRNPSISFEGLGSNIASYECRLGNGAFTPCSSPANYTNLLDGSYSFTVRALGSAGQELASVSHSWTVSSPLNLTVAAAYPTNGAQWLDHVKNDGSGVLSATDTTCATSDTPNSACLHGGEIRRVALPGVTSCSGLTLSDALGVFDWSCVVLSGNAVFYSSGFKTGKGLKDLLDPTAWKQNSVSLSGTYSGSSPSAAWWTNPVVALPDNSAGSIQTINNTGFPQGSILTLPSSRATAGYFVLAHKIAIVTLGSAVLNYSGNPAGNCNGSPSDQCLFDMRGNFTWLEGNFSGLSGGAVNADYGHYQGGAFSRLHNSSFDSIGNVSVRLISGDSQKVTRVSANGGNWGLGIDAGSDGNQIEDLDIRNISNCVHVSGINNTLRRIRSSNCSGGPFYLAGSNNTAFDIFVSNSSSGPGLAGTGNTMTRLVSMGHGSNGLQVSGSSNTLTQAVISASGNGIQMWTGTSGNTLSQVTLVNNWGNGIYFIGGGTENTFNQILAVNAGNGIRFQTASSSKNTFSQLAVVNNGIGIDLQNFSDSSKLTGALLMGENSTSNCNVTGGTDPGATHSSCTTTGTDGSNAFGSGALSNAVLRTGRSAASSFIGKISTDDPMNVSDTNGSAAYPASPTTFDWINFADPFRAWNRDGGTFPSTDNRGGWGSGTGRIWDFRLRSTDSAFLNRSGDGSTLNQSFVAGGACPSAVDGNLVAVDQHTSPRTYLLNAAEITDPLEVGYGATGNRNGLCESNESCLYTPNFGAYQGEGSLGTCTFADGTVSGVTMWGYSTNGVN